MFVQCRGGPRRRNPESEGGTSEQVPKRNHSHFSTVHAEFDRENLAVHTRDATNPSGVIGQSLGLKWSGDHISRAWLTIFNTADRD